MKLEKADFDQILQKYLNGQAGKKEIDFLHAYYNAFEQSQDFTSQLSDEKRLSLEQHLQSRILKNLGNHKRSRILNPFFLKYAAAVILISGITLAYFLFSVRLTHQNKFPQLVEKQHQKSKEIVLTLANGSQINLKNGVLATAVQEIGATVKSKENGDLDYQALSVKPAQESYNQIDVPAGKQFKITLSDGTKVWLNAVSSVKYPVAFQDAQRVVYLTGEAYFEVSKDKTRPFIVKTKQSSVEVTGTEFNIMSLPEENDVRTTLLEGSVNVAYANSSVKLIPGEEALSNIPNHTIVKSKADIENAIAWKSGYFIFNHPLKDVMVTLSRWYGARIILDQKLEKSTIAGKFSNKRSLLQILTYMGKLKGFSIQVHGNVFEITSKK
ncbi:FecR family protein [Pedobacter frigidisoli]|uniref:FecR family protein n=1 Tax=Pedobacter frigidisoli TaxID=2530455 RepID=UPI00292D3E8B|nr:FecR domain-containing protein [Pedobacter frigidisoli]